MEQLTINLPDESAAQLKTVAHKSGVKPEDFLLASLQERLARVDAEFIHAMRYVLKRTRSFTQELVEWLEKKIVSLSPKSINPTLH